MKHVHGFSWTGLVRGVFWFIFDLQLNFEIMEKSKITFEVLIDLWSKFSNEAKVYPSQLWMNSNTMTHWYGFTLMTDDLLPDRFIETDIQRSERLKSMQDVTVKWGGVEFKGVWIHDYPKTS